MENILKRDFVIGIKNVAKVNFPKFYEKFVLNFNDDDSMVASICLLIDVDKYYNEYKNAKKHFTQLCGFKNEEFELMYYIDIIKDIALSLDMYDTLNNKME